MTSTPNLLLDALEGGTLDLPYLRMKGKAIGDEDFSATYWTSAPRRNGA